jgi:hypothetical protein
MKPTMNRAAEIAAAAFILLCLGCWLYGAWPLLLGS